MPTPAELADELRRLHETMTPGPWYSDQDYRVYGPVPENFDRTKDTAPCIFETKHFEGTGHDSDGCAALRNRLPDIIKCLEELETLKRQTG